MAKKPDLSVPGLLIIDKPAGMTSHDVVSRLRRVARTRKVGHAGTLDPMATGILTIGVGKATRLLNYLTSHDKTYQATIRFGIETSTEDKEGVVVAAKGCVNLDVTEVDAHMGLLTGDIMQVPSKVSAIKIDGNRAYALVREGEDFKIPARPVTIAQFQRLSDLRVTSVEVDGTDVPVVDVDVEVSCSAGTYIRALARDLGTTLGCGAHLTALRRTRVGAFTLEDSHPLNSVMEEHEARGETEEILAAPGLIPLGEALRKMYPCVDLNEARSARFANGQAPDVTDLCDVSTLEVDTPIGVFTPAGEPQGLITWNNKAFVTLMVFA